MTLSIVLRDLLIAHIDGPYVVPAVLLRTRSVAIRTGLLRPDFAGLRIAYQARPRQTFLTTKGRQMLAEALADWADALVRADRIGDQVRSLLANVPREVAEAKYLDEVG